MSRIFCRVDLVEVLEQNSDLFMGGLYGIRLSHIVEIPNVSNEKPSISIIQNS